MPPPSLPPGLVSILRRAHQSALDRIHSNECSEHYGSADWEKPFKPSGRKPTRAEVFEALKTLPYDEHALNSLLEIGRMMDAGWSREEIQKFLRGREEEDRARGLHIDMWEEDYYPRPKRDE